jgi:D-alanine-D-alanine ligase
LDSKEGSFFAEEYIDGREFNVSMTGPSGHGKVLAIAEMLFKDWPLDELKIVGYKAKWDENSSEYKNTVRTFDFPESDKPLLEKIGQISTSCWNLFPGLRGYVRIDLRVKDKIPYVLEINANPCISRDAGFIAAAHYAGMSDEQVIRNIIKDSCGEEFVL